MTTARDHGWIFRGLGLALAVCILGIASRESGAGLMPDPEPAAGASKLEFEALPYGWLSGIYGTVTAKGRTAHISASPGDVYDLLTGGNAFAAAGYFSLAYDRFEIFSDTVGGYAELHIDERIPTQFCTLAIRGRDKTKYVIGDVAFGYRLGRWSLPDRRRPLTLGVYVGSRYMYFSNQLNATGGVAGGVQNSANSFESFAWADPMIGIRFSAPLLDWFSLDFRGDIGGFDASSHLIWGLAGTGKVWMPWTPFELHPYLAAGYRVVDFDRSSSAGSINMQFSGPTVGMGFVF